MNDITNLEIIQEINKLIKKLKDKGINIKDDNDTWWYLDSIQYNPIMDEIIFYCATNQ